MKAIHQNGFVKIPHKMTYLFARSFCHTRLYPWKFEGKTRVWSGGMMRNIYLYVGFIYIFHACIGEIKCNMWHCFYVTMEYTWNVWHM